MFCVVGVDPGRTTGFCVISEKGTPLSWGELGMDELMQTLERIVSLMHVPVYCVLEDIVPTGRLNKDKIDQIKAFDRAYLTLLENAENMVIVPPESRRITTHKVPKSIQGGHAKDAFLLAVSWAEREGLITGGEHGSSEDKQSKKTGS